RVNLDSRRGEIFGLLGPNGAGKTTLINIICGIVTPSAGTVAVGGHDILRDYRAARAMIGLVPQELTSNAFESVWATVSFSRGLFGKPANPGQVEKVLRDLSLWDRKDSKIMTLSGGMKRRVLIAKALAHEPQVLFLDEPTAGVDVELRQDMWQVVRFLRDSGVTIILTTHYIEEGDLGDLRVRDGAHRPHAAAKHRRPGDLDVAVLRGVRRGHRHAHRRDRRSQLRRLHRAGAGDADAADAERRERLVRHLLSQVHR